MYDVYVCMHVGTQCMCTYVCTYYTMYIYNMYIPSSRWIDGTRVYMYVHYNYKFRFDRLFLRANLLFCEFWRKSDTFNTLVPVGKEDDLGEGGDLVDCVAFPPSIIAFTVSGDDTFLDRCIVGDDEFFILIFEFSCDDLRLLLELLELVFLFIAFPPSRLGCRLRVAFLTRIRGEGPLGPLVLDG